MWYAGDGMGWWMLWGGLMMAAFWGGIIVLIVWAFQALTRRDAGLTERTQLSPSGGDSLEIARERYARGEISRDEFVQARRDLDGG